MRTQNQTILNHLRRYGKITTWTAIERYGITRLSGRIYDLRNKYLIPIDGKNKTVSTKRFGKTTICEYRMFSEKQKTYNWKNWTR
jgi:hypothetical protein